MEAVPLKRHKRVSPVLEHFSLNDRSLNKGKKPWVTASKEYPSMSIIPRECWMINGFDSQPKPYWKKLPERRQNHFTTKAISCEEMRRIVNMIYK